VFLTTRASQADSHRATIRKFVVAGQFIEVLRCFENGMTEEV
jgi:vacuolar protein sorting-associated protein VTA1